MKPSLVDAVSRRIGTGFSRRSLFRRAAVMGSALAVAPWTYVLKPGTAYAAICNCGGLGCNCNDLCCRGYTEFCCTLTGTNACPSDTVIAGWWKADGSGFCDVNGQARPRYYVDCNNRECSCSCGSSGTCSPSCVSCNCGCANGDCRNRRACCVQFRYGQCNNQMPCVGPIVCRVVTCTPPWELDATCSTAVLTDNHTRFHDAPCLHPEQDLHAWIVGGTLAIQDVVHTHLASCSALGSVRRISGGSRYSTAAEVSRQFFYDPTTVDQVFIVTGSNYPDALAAAPVAARNGAPILLTDTGTLPGSTAEELARLKPSEIVVLGGVGAISDAVVNQLSAYAGKVRRIAGNDRYATAAAVSTAFFSPGQVSQVFVVTGEDFPDALSVGAVAGTVGAPVLLVRPDQLPGTTRTELVRLAPTTITVVGGTTAISDAVYDQLATFANSIERIAGDSRYGTAAQVSRRYFPAGSADRAFVVTGRNFPDALAVAPVAALEGAPLILVTDTSVPAPTAGEVARLGGAPCPAS